MVFLCVRFIQHIGYSSMLQWNQVCSKEVRLCVCMHVSFCGFICLLFILFMFRI